MVHVRNNRHVPNCLWASHKGRKLECIKAGRAMANNGKTAEAEGEVMGIQTKNGLLPLRRHCGRQLLLATEEPVARTFQSAPLMLAA